MKTEMYNMPKAYPRKKIRFPMRIPDPMEEI